MSTPWDECVVVKKKIACWMVILYYLDVHVESTRMTNMKQLILKSNVGPYGVCIICIIVAPQVRGDRGWLTNFAPKVRFSNHCIIFANYHSVHTF